VLVKLNDRRVKAREHRRSLARAIAKVSRISGAARRRAYTVATEDEVAEAESQVFVSVVGVYKALGGIQTETTQ